MKRWMQAKTRRERGIVVLMTAVTVLIMMPVAGLAIDAAILYAVKSRLQSASDAAAIAAARSLNVGMSLSEQVNSARQRAVDFFNANYPTGTWSTRDKTITVDVAETGFKTRTVTVTTGVTVPQYFLRLLGFYSSRVAAEGKASRRDVNLILVLDRSGSMADTSTVKPCSTMKAASKNFIDMFAEGRDRIGVMQFSTHTYPVLEPTMTFKTGSPTVYSRIDSITCAGWTSSAAALQSAYDRLVTINEPGALNIIVFFTDGVPTAVSGKFPYKLVTDTRAGYTNYKGWDTTVTPPTACTTTGTTTLTSCSMEPSPCKDAQGDQYHRDNSGSKSAAGSYKPPTYPNWNPNWAPSGTMDGVIAGGDLNPPLGGDTQGIFKVTGSSMSDSSTRLTTTSCDFTNSASRVRRDVAYIPNVDFFNNNILSGYKVPPTFPTGHPYVGKVRPDSVRSVVNASVNATDSVGSKIRTDMGLKPIIFCIGLGTVDDELLRRLSNDPDSPIFDSSLAQGMYVYANTVADMNEAFLRVASEILRIAK